jgi:hypothetical protein
MQAREHESIVARKDAELEELQAQLAARETELASASQEVQRLTTLVRFAEPATSRVGGERGLEPQG